MDYIALSGANCFLKRGKTVRRLFLTAALSSITSLLFTLVIQNFELRLLFLHFILNTAMVFVGFGKCRKKEFIENWALMYFLTLILGGIMEWEAGFLSNFWIQAVLAAVILSLATYYLGRRKQFGNQIFKTVIKNREKQVEVYAYWDSGNQLKDPYTGRPVSILGRAEAEQVYETKKDGIRYIPFQSLGEKNGLLPVFSVESVSIDSGRKRTVVAPAVIGIADAGLMDGKEYRLILHASMLEK